MKYLSPLLFTLLFSSGVWAQVAVQNDSLFLEGNAIASYGLFENTKKGVVIEVNVFSPYLTSDSFLQSEERKKFEQLVKEGLKGKPFILSNAFYFQYTFQSEIQPEILNAGQLLERAGKNYNAAIALSTLGSAGGIALSLGGYPIAGAIVTLGGNIIGFFVQIGANMKLIEAGQRLKEAK